MVRLRPRPSDCSNYSGVAVRDHSKGIRRSSVRFMALAVVAMLGMNPMCLASDEDFLYWTKASFLVPIREQWEFGFAQKTGFEDEARRLDHHSQDYGLSYTHANGWLKLQGALKHAHAPTADRNDWTHEIRPHFSIAFLSKLRGVDVINRSRLEYRHFEDYDNIWRFRHKIRIDSPVRFTPLQIEPYMADEIFYNFNADRFYGNRVQAGLFIPLHEKVRLDLFYFWHTRKQDDQDWSNTNVIGSYVRFKF
jgi:hypothetical protein